MTWKDVAETAKGWLHPPEGPALHAYADSVAHLGALCEIGGYAGKSACWLGAVARDHDTILFSLDWHRGSPEMSVDRECHDPDMVQGGLFDSLPHFRANIHAAGLEPWVVPVVGSSPRIGLWWTIPLAFLFIDAAHDYDGCLSDYSLFARHVVPGGILAFHDSTIGDIDRVAHQATREGFTLEAQIESLRVLRCSR